MSWHTQPASGRLLPSPQAQIGLKTALIMPICALLAVAAAVVTATVTAVEAAVAVAATDAAGMIDTL